MTKEEFEKRYCEQSGITKEEYDEYEITLPCNCDYEECKGWAAVSNNDRAIKHHMEFYGK